jgi:hypothetical protein
MSISVVIPFKSDNLYRQKSFDWVKLWWKINFPGWQKLVAFNDPFTKAGAINYGVRETSGDTIVIADSDCFTPDVAGLQRLVEEVESGKQPWMTPHRFVYRLPEKISNTVYEENSIDLKGLTRSIGCIGGGLLIVSREAWNISGGFDERFTTWGGEDVSFGMALESLCGPQTRGRLDLVHLWHPPMSGDFRLPDSTARLIQDYRRASRHPDRMRALIAGRTQHSV